MVGYFLRATGHKLYLFRFSVTSMRFYFVCNCINSRNCVINNTQVHDLYYVEGIAFLVILTAKMPFPQIFTNRCFWFLQLLVKLSKSSSY